MMADNRQPRWFVYHVDRDQCAEPDWYETPLSRLNSRDPLAMVVGRRVELYSGRLTLEMARNLFAAIEATN